MPNRPHIISSRRPRTTLQTDTPECLRPVAIWGARGHAKVLNEFLPELGFEVVVLFDNDTTLTSPFAEVPLWHGIDGFQAWLTSRTHSPKTAALVAIGGERGQLRVEILDRLQSAGLDPITVIHPTAFVAADAQLGAGTQILANAAVCADSQLGRGCIINTKASVDHECILGDGVHLAPGVTLAGCVEVGAFSMIAVGAVVLPRRKIGRHSIIGAGAVVTRDIPDNVIAYGNPARIIQANVT